MEHLFGVTVMSSGGGGASVPLGMVRKTSGQTDHREGFSTVGATEPLETN